jgi:hypothetical protein
MLAKRPLEVCQPSICSWFAVIDVGSGNLAAFIPEILARLQDEAVESVVRTLAEHWASWGGASLQCVFDWPKTIVLRWGKTAR